MNIRLKPVPLIGLSVLILAVFGASSALLFGVYVRHSEGALIRQTGSWLPAAKVGSKTVTYSEYLGHVDAAAKFMAIQGPAEGLSGAMTDAERAGALDRAIRIEAVQEMADEKTIIVTPLDLDRAIDQTLMQAGTSTTIGEFREYLDKVYGWSEDEFKRFILGPALLEEAVKRAYVRDGKTEADFTAELERRMGEPYAKRYLKFS
jgi:hypothetical protein